MCARVWSGHHPVPGSQETERWFRIIFSYPAAVSNVSSAQAKIGPIVFCVSLPLVQMSRFSEVAYREAGKKGELTGV